MAYMFSVVSLSWQTPLACLLIRVPHVHAACRAQEAAALQKQIAQLPPDESAEELSKAAHHSSAVTRGIQVEATRCCTVALRGVRHTAWQQGS